MATPDLRHPDQAAAEPPLPAAKAPGQKAPGRALPRESLVAGVKAAVGIIGLFVVWELLVLVIDPADYLFVGPLSAFAELIERPGYFAENTFVTLQEALAGFALGTALGVLCGAALHYSATARSFLYPALIAIDTIPKVALAPLFIVWFGFGFESKAFVAMAIAFFPLVINTYDGLSSVPHELQELARINRASPWKKMVKIDFIYAIPSIFSGAKISISLAVGGAVVGEFIAGSKGLGYVILLANSQVDLPSMFAAFIVLAAIALTLFFLVDYAGRKLAPWKNHAK
ncbi:MULTISPECIES: ABC transporter permease [Streptomyces]|uniref:ABC transporter permease n=3 Tax=Streptomyces TaxID=1883 RepID=A0A8H9HDC1_9ACTN|nr:MULTISPECIES: ABC transporter permease [Streptomyces]NEE61136.1 ABC transporter permease [Streptomyces sp. SID8455]MBL3803682.1 ABC transporter permease [Streptomyces sp. BRB081]MDQ0292688.1 NitT/TauT family transport system permease protein [Streptomyces sp. DSM 41037]QNE83894.1 ABC transporter permease subunit [Streptomyces rutgersensis]WPR53914.1 ABC transporter permease [Streptomyces sp. S399]